MKKLGTEEYKNYWKNVHVETGNDLAAVCFPGKSAYYNRFFDRTQIYALEMALRALPLDLRNKQLLDVGCGRGRWLNYFRHRFGAITSGIDLSEEAIQSCLASGLDAQVASVTALPMPDASFDVLTSITVLLHIPYDQKAKAVSEISRVLKPGGHAILLENTWSKDPSPHVYGLTVEQWTDLFRENGFDRTYASALYFNWFRRTIPSIRGLLDDFAVTLDYPIEYFMMRLLKGKISPLGLQHVMIFQKSK